MLSAVGEGGKLMNMLWVMMTWRNVDAIEQYVDALLMGLTALL